jgi:hypothetical protein
MIESSITKAFRPSRLEHSNFGFDICLGFRASDFGFLSIVLLVLFAFAGSGCHRASTAEDDHLEHHHPPHKPPHLAAAIDQIERRYAALAAAESNPPAEFAEQLQELLDIVRWLPEIAGDSDLAEAPWNVVDQVSLELAPPLATALHQAQRGQPAALAPFAPRMQEAVTRLRAICPPHDPAADEQHEHKDHQQPRDDHD